MIDRDWSIDWLNNIKEKLGSKVKEERINFLFLKDGSMVYPYSSFDGYPEAMIDAINKGEDIDDLISLVFPEKVDHPIVKKKLLKLMNK